MSTSYRGFYIWALRNGSFGDDMISFGITRESDRKVFVSHWVCGSRMQAIIETLKTRVDHIISSKGLCEGFDPERWDGKQ